MIEFTRLAGAFGSRGLAALGGVLLSIIVARAVGPEGLGRFAVFVSLLGFFCILARRGLDMLLIRSIAWARRESGSGIPVTMFGYCASRVLAPAFFLGCIGAALLASGWVGKPLTGSVALMPLAVVFFTIAALAAGYFKGRSLTWLAPFFEIGGVSLLATCFVAIGVLAGSSPNEMLITCAFVGALFVLVLVAGITIRRDAPLGQRPPVLAAEQKLELRSGQVDFTLIALAVFLTQAGSFVLVAPILAEEELGYLRAAERFAVLVSFPMLVINPFIAPRIARLWREGNALHLGRLVLAAVVGCSAVAAAILAPLLVFPARVLDLMGAGFAEGSGYLRLMACAHFVAAVLGPLGVLLNMVGGERKSMWINLGTLIAVLVLAPLGALFFSANGFAVVYSFMIAIRYALVARYAIRYVVVK